MTPKEKAEQLFTDFQQYYWDRDIGWMPDELKSKEMALKVVDEIEQQAIEWGVVSVQDYWKRVRLEINRWFTWCA